MPIYHFRNPDSEKVVSIVLSFKEYDQFESIYHRVSHTLEKGEKPDGSDLEFLSSKKIFVDGTLLERVFDPTAVIFKGKGFYSTDNRPKSEKKEE